MVIIAVVVVVGVAVQVDRNDDDVPIVFVPYRLSIEFGCSIVHTWDVSSFVMTMTLDVANLESTRS